MLRAIGYFFAAILIAGFVAAMFGIEGPDVDLTLRPAADSQRGRAGVAQDSPAREGEAPPADGDDDPWIVTEATSAMDDSRTVELSVFGAHDPRHLGTAHTSGLLHIRCKEGRTEVYVGTQEYFDEFYEEPVRIRLDDAPAVPQVWSVSERRVLFAPQPIRLARALSETDLLRIQYNTSPGRPDVLFFRLDGLPKHIGKVAAACHWPK